MALVNLLHTTEVPMKGPHENVSYHIKYQGRGLMNMLFTM